MTMSSGKSALKEVFSQEIYKEYISVITSVILNQREQRKKEVECFLHSHRNSVLHLKRDWVILICELLPIDINWVLLTQYFQLETNSSFHSPLAIEVE